MADVTKLFLKVSKDNYTNLVSPNITSSDPNYYKIAFIDDGSGIITRGTLYVNSPYFIKTVDSIEDVPDEENQQADTIYLVTEE